MLDSYIYNAQNDNFAIGTTIGASINNNKYFKTNIQMTYRLFKTNKLQKNFNFIQSYYYKNNTEIKFKFKYMDKFLNDEKSFKIEYNYFF